jgi:predicted unusual protein kinase regulating ubiquinone biosynthesis (AarF/ABC1/UbiB family)
MHADLHAGNVGIDTVTGGVTLFDFGQVAEIPALNMKRVLFALIDRDSELVTSILLKAGAVSGPKDVISNFVKTSMAYLETSDIIAFAKALQTVDQTVTVSQGVTSVMRSLALLEGTCKEFDPGFSMYSVVDELVADYMPEYMDYRAKRDIRFLMEKMFQEYL